jgi:hypothetical protein
MSFWSDASPAVKGIIVVGGIALVGVLVFALGDFGGADVEAQQQRGLQSGSK